MNEKNFYQKHLIHQNCVIGICKRNFFLQKFFKKCVRVNLNELREHFSNREQFDSQKLNIALVEKMLIL